MKIAIAAFLFAKRDMDVYHKKSPENSGLKVI
jgi:hypothetical protein